MAKKKAQKCELMFVGVEPSELLNKMIDAMGVKRSIVAIADVTEIRKLKPKVVVAMGETAIKNLLQTDEPLEQLRGKTFESEGAVLIPTFHPAYLLKNPAAKKEAWEDLKLAMKVLKN